MKEQRNLAKFVISLICLLCCVIFSDNLLWAAETPKKLVIKCGSGLTPKHFPVITAKKLAELAAQKSNNQIEFQFYLQAVLGSERDLYEGLQIGTVDAVVGLVTVLANFDPRVGVLDIPYVFDDIQHAHNALVKGNVGKKLNEGLIKKANIRILGWLVGGPQEEFRTLSTTSRIVQKPEDLRGLKIRVPEGPIFTDFFKLYGANPTPIPMGEVYTSLQTNVVDGVEIPAYAILTRKYYEVCKNMALTNHIYTANLLAVGERFFNKLTADQKRILMESTAEAIAWQQTQNPPENVLDALKKHGMKITAVDIKPFKDKATGLQDSYAKKVGAFDVLEEIRKIK